MPFQISLQQGLNFCSRRKYHSEPPEISFSAHRDILLSLRKYLPSAASPSSDCDSGLVWLRQLSGAATTQHGRCGDADDCGGLENGHFIGTQECHLPRMVVEDGIVSGHLLFVGMVFGLSRPFLCGRRAPTFVVPPTYFYRKKPNVRAWNLGPCFV